MTYGMGRAMGTAACALVLCACGSSDGKAGASGGGAGTSAGAPDSAGSAGMSAGAGGKGLTTAGGSASGGVEAGGAADALGGGGSGGTVGKHCTTAQPFGAPQPLMELNTAEHEAGARLTSDELTVVYLCAAGEVNKICLAQRASPSAAFGKPTVIVTLNGGVPWISDDLLTLFYEDTLKNSGISRTQRTSSQAAFPETGFDPAWASYGDPYVVGGANGRLYLSEGTLGDFDFAPLTAWEPGSPQPVPRTGRAGARPTLTPDELTLYFVSSPPTASKRSEDIWVQQRPSLNDPFGAAVNVTELNVADQNFPSWISPDGCRLYFDAGDFPRDLYFAERN